MRLTDSRSLGICAAVLVALCGTASAAAIATYHTNAGTVVTFTNPKYFDDAGKEGSWNKGYNFSYTVSGKGNKRSNVGLAICKPDKHTKPSVILYGPNGEEYDHRIYVGDDSKITNNTMASYIVWYALCKKDPDRFMGRAR